METWGGSDVTWGLGGDVGGVLKEWELGKIVFVDYWKGRDEDPDLDSSGRGFKGMWLWH